MDPILEVSHLRKLYRQTEAVADVSFSVKEGVCLGLLGPNGAGKTTTMEMAEDIIQPNEGEILYQGHPRTNSFREEIGIQFQHTSLLNFLSVEETLQTFHKLFREPEDLNLLIQRCELGSLLKRRNDKLSGGQLQRLMLALALINKPRLVFLDEPSTGLDPQSRRNLWEIVLRIKEEGKTIILTTHSMEEAEYLCDEVAIMDQGRVIAWDSPKQLIQTYCQGAAFILPESAFRLDLDRLPFSWKQKDGQIILEITQIHEGLNTLLNLDVDLSGMSVHTPNLEDVFIHLTGKQLRD
ncbi:MAG: ABC transporter ATP-binding protein [Proteobacteria bacterium]|nr:ABC transporter ATP-binding protein [Pseudomonadota bacterium]MBU1233021.1 ABC transporter ATP-binding protein [Pseudomonadota bacterium]MBU1420808.1 ABC transporter ATP-binding protein [Pseudomonadota bacterium]MBU1454858.1 ABC transporter ATP-binding protein [Pseudomonadota bacterium]